MKKVGRNQVCPCGSGKKYKHCHLSNTQSASSLSQQQAHRTAAHIQRERQQGLGKPIISADFKGTRFVAVKGKLLHSTKWKTFHDFLGDYIKNAVGSAWGNAEIAKPPEERHPLIVWYQTFCRQQREYLGETPDIRRGMPETGAAAAYLRLAYDLYALDHNAELQERLLRRLRNHERFSGARYEIQVAAIFIRAGFDIEFEDESDGSTTHCEFTATFRATGRKFSVEAKRREGHRPRIGRLFNDALAKRAAYPRVVFIDLNMRDDGPATDSAPPAFFESAVRRLRLLEGQPLNGVLRPPAYVFLTNTPWELNLESPATRCGRFAEGFQIPDFTSRGTAQSLRHVIDARERHIEMHSLIKSLIDHSEVPATFDGEIPEFAFNPDIPRLRVGSRYWVKDAEGKERPAEVTTAVVAEEERAALCGVTFEDGTGGICRMPLSEMEIAAWKRHPDTFFGVPTQRQTRAETPLDLYDFFHASYMTCSVERLLELLSDAPDLEQLRKLTQKELASIYAERLTYGAMQNKTK